MWEDRGQRGQGHLPRKARAGCESRYPQTTWFRPDPPSVSLPANSFRIHTCLPKLHVHWLPSRHHISLHYAQCPENPPMKREDTSVYVSPAPLATPTFCLHCACTPGVSRLGVTNISGASCPPPHSCPKLRCSLKLCSHPLAVSPWTPSQTSGCLCSTIIFMHGFDLSLVPHLQSVLTPAQASHLLSPPFKPETALR